MLDPVEFGKAMASIVKEATAPLLKRIEELESRQPEKGADGRDGVDGKSVTVEDVAPMIAEQVKSAVDAIPKPRDGKDGRDGQDAPPIEIDVADVVKELLAADGIKQLVGLEVEAFLVENPPAPGKDGEPGKDGAPGEPGKSVTLDDVSVFLDAAVAKHVLDFERRAGEKLDKAIERIPVPKDGRDGVDLTEVSMEFDGERTVTVKGRTGEVSKRLPIPLWRGYWSEGVVAERGDILTHNGTAYIAVADNPKCEPGVGKYDHEWKVFARKGRDGKDGRNGIDRTKSVDLKKKPRDE